MSVISNNLEQIQENISKAAIKSGRHPFDITLVGVTKMIDINRISELISLGIFDLGENRVQELIGKQPQLDEKTRWHLIGHLQTNKVKTVVDKVHLIHSLDSIKLANEIDKRAREKNITAKVLVEVNIANDRNKQGISSNFAMKMVENLLNLKNIEINGLMTVAPYVENPDENRIYFYKMNQLFIDIQSEFRDNINMRILSMGMTNDYQVAIEEGSNMVRIGTGIFGDRLPV